MRCECRTLVRMAFSVLGSIITLRFPVGRAVKGLLQPQDATSRHRTSIPHSCGSRLYLHPALLWRKSEGPACDSGHRLIPFSGIGRTISRFFLGKEPISRYGVKLFR